jgi:hypothetical protein
MTLQKKHLDAIDTCINTWDDNVEILGKNIAAEKCSKISIEYAILFHKWMLKEDTESNAEKYANFTDKDMFDAFLKSLAIIYNFTL